MKPPLTLTPKILQLVEQIGHHLGRHAGLATPVPQPKLRRKNRIRTIQGSLAIEGNTLSLDQMTLLLDNKRVLGPKNQILEVKNAISLYEKIHLLNPTSLKDLLKAHEILLRDLDADAGKLRKGAVGILKGTKVSHVAPQAKRVPELIADLFEFVKNEKQWSRLIVACVFHYEFEFIHPFLDGNGRLGRFWQSLILRQHAPIFEYLPVESLIKARQRAYYRALEASDKAGDAGPFVEFSLQVIHDALNELLSQLRPRRETSESRLLKAKEHFGAKEFSRKEYLELNKAISTATASRDLAVAVKSKLLVVNGTRATARYRFS